MGFLPALCSNDDSYVLHAFRNAVHIIIIAVLAPLLFAPNLDPVQITRKHHILIQTSELAQRLRHQDSSLLIQLFTKALKSSTLYKLSVVSDQLNLLTALLVHLPPSFDEVSKVFPVKESWQLVENANAL